MPGLNLPKRKIGTTQQVSQRCLPGGPRSATYDANTYTYKADNLVNITDGLEPSILAIEGDKSVGGYLYSSASGDSNYNRGQFPQPHTITEKSFYTELVSEYNQPGAVVFGGDPEELYQNRRILYGLNNKPFLRVDLTEGGRVFRHNTVIVRGSIQCTNHRFIQFGQTLGTESNPNKLWGTVDFEWIFTCHPLHSKTTTNPNYTEGLGQLATLNTSYLQLKNRAYGDSGPQALIEDGTLKMFTPVSPLMGAWGANFAMQSDTGTHPDNISIVPKVLRQYSSEQVYEYTPYSMYFSEDENEKWDLNFVEFRFPLPWLDNTPVNHGVPPRFAIKGTYLLI